MSGTTPEGQGELGLVAYVTAECSAQFTLDAPNGTVWATQQQIAAAFGIASNTVTEHLKRIFSEGELEEAAVARRIRATGPDGKQYNYLHYSLDAILSVGYRVSSKRATAFRQWASGVLKSYATKGYALNEALLARDADALRDLAAKVRALRADEKARYRAVRDVFAFASTDYDADAAVARAFFAKVQDKFLYATTGQTAAQIILDRADHEQPNMGLTTMKGGRPATQDIVIGKNYLDRDELYVLHMLSEQFLLFVESAAMRGLRLTMQQIAGKFDELLKVQGYEVMHDYGPDYLRGRADEHARRELASYRTRLAANPRGNL